jgi:tetratricopeptide (TPR) repeat protein
MAYQEIAKAPFKFCLMGIKIVRMKKFCLIFLSFGFLFSQGELLELGKKYVSEGKYELAEEIFTSLFERHGEKEIGKRALLERAFLYLSKGDTLKARNDLMVLEKKTLSESLAYVVSSTLSELDVDKGGEYLLKFALKFPLSSKTKEALEGAAHLFEKSGNLERAILAYKKLSEISPRERKKYQIQIGRLWGYLGKFGRSKRLLKRYSDSIQVAKLYLAQTYILEGDTAKAIFLLKSLETHRSKLLLADLYISLGILEEAKRILDTLSLIPEVGKSEINYRRMKIFLMEKNLEGAETILPSIVDTLLISRFYLERNMPESCLVYLRKRVDEESKYLRAKAYLKRGELFPAYEEALTLPDSYKFNDVKIEIAKKLNSKELYRESIGLIGNLKKWYPREEVLKILYSSYILIGDTSKADSIGKLLISKGVQPPSVYKSGDLLRIYAKYAGRRASLAGALLNMGAYERVIELLRGKKLNYKEAEILASAYTSLFLNTRDTLFALEAEGIYKKMKNKPPGYYVLHSLWDPDGADLRGVALTNFTEKERFHLSILYARRGMKRRAYFVTQYIKDEELRNEALFKIYLYSGNFDSAYIYLDEKKLDDVYSLARAYSSIGEDEISLALLDYIPVEGFSLDEKAQFQRIVLLARNGKYEDVRREASIYFKIFPQGSKRDSVKKIVGYAYLRTGDPGKAFLSLLPYNDYESLKIKALSLIEMGIGDEAEKMALDDREVLWKLYIRRGDYKKLLELSPREGEDLNPYLEFLLEKSPVDTFRRVIDNFRERGLLNGDEAQIWLVRSLLKEGKLDEAREVFEFLPIEEKKEAAYYIGLSYFKRREFEEAKKYFLRGIESKDQDIKGRSAFKIATILTKEGKFRDALEFYKRSLELLKDSEIKRMAIFNRAISFKKLGINDSAIYHYRRIIELYPESEDAEDAAISLAFLLMDVGKTEEALALLENLTGEMRGVEEEAERIYWKGEALVSLNRPYEALNTYLILFKYYADVDNWGITSALKAGKLYAFLGEVDSAKKIYLEVINKRGVSDPFGKIAKEELEKLP